MRVLVTGASGFIGTEVLGRLAADERFAPVAGRRDVPAEGPGGTGGRSVPVVRLDLTEPASVAAAVDGVDAVVHCAVGDRRVTVDGTRLLLQACARAGVPRVVHLSSIAVYGGATGVVGEDTPMVAGARGYAGWKVEAERACVAPARPGEPEPSGIVRLRPTIVYGPGSELWVGGMLRRLRSGRWGTLGAAGEGTCNPVHVSDVAAAVLAALTAGDRAVGRAFNVNGEESLTWNDWFTALASAAGLETPPALTARTLRRRRALGTPLKAVLKAVRRVLPSVDPDYLLGVPSRSEVDLFALRATYPVEAAAAALGWRPRVLLADGLADAVAGERS